MCWCVKCWCVWVFAWNIGMTRFYIWVLVIEYLCICNWVFVYSYMYLSATMCDGVLAMVGQTMLCICVFSLHFYLGIYVFVSNNVWWCLGRTSSRSRTPVGRHERNHHQHANSVSSHCIHTMISICLFVYIAFFSHICICIFIYLYFYIFEHNLQQCANPASSQCILFGF